MTTTTKLKLNIREGVVHLIAKMTVEYMAKLAIEYSPDISQAVEVQQDVVRHLMKRLKAERRGR